MCLIIAPGADGKPALLPRDVFDYVYKRNDDGFGAMWTEDGRVNHFKTLGLSSDEIYASMEEYVERFPDVIFHMRFKTHGKIIPGLSHPFRILHKNRHGKDLFFMHNGVLGQFGNSLTHGQSDTTVFKDKILVPLLTRNPDALDDPETWDAINKLTSGSRLIFLDSDGKVKRSSEKSWNTRYGLTLSNEYMLPTEKVVPLTGNYSGGSSTRVGSNGNGGSGLAKPSSGYTYYRTVEKDGKEQGHWCSCPKEGYVRTDAGHLYKDAGANKKIYHALEFIPKDMEYTVLGIHTLGTPPSTGGLVRTTIEEPNAAPFGQELDDDLPFDLAPVNDDLDDDYAEDKTSGIAPVDQRLRYARLVHNLFGGSVTSRHQLLADLIGMDEEELGGFVNEDPVNAHTVIAELVEMVLEFNDELFKADSVNDRILDINIMMELGDADNHRKAMQGITDLRKIQYKKKVQEKIEADKTKKEAA